MLPNDPAMRRKSVREMKDFTCRFILFPIKWTQYPERVKDVKLSWSRIRFDRDLVKHLPDNKKGVYSFILEPEIAGHKSVGYMLYVGKAAKQSLRKRCQAYLYEPSNPKGRILIQEMIDRWDGHLWLHFATVDDEAVIHQVEEDLIEAFIPPYNDDFPATISRQAKAVYRC